MLGEITRKHLEKDSSLCWDRIADLVNEWGDDTDRVAWMLVRGSFAEVAMELKKTQSNRRKK